MAKLKPCPFCGGTDIVIGHKPTNNRELEKLIIIVWLECNTCGAKTKAVSCTTESEKRIEEAFTKIENAWNRRASDGK